MTRFGSSAARVHRLVFIVRDKDGHVYSQTGTHGVFHPELRAALFFKDSGSVDAALQALKKRNPRESYTIADIDIDLSALYDARVNPQREGE